MAQWLRVHLPMQGTRVRAPVREDPTCRGAAGPLSLSPLLQTGETTRRPISVEEHVKLPLRASLVAQWLRVRLPMLGTRVRAPVREDPTCRGAAGPVSHGC